MIPKGRMTVGQLAAFLGVSERTVERWWAAGKLPTPERHGKVKTWTTAQARIIERDLVRRAPRGQVRL